MQKTLKLFWTLTLTNGASLLPASTQVVAFHPGSPTEEIRQSSGEDNHVQAAAIDSRTISMNLSIGWEMYIFFHSFQKLTFSPHVTEKGNVSFLLCT